MSGMSLKLKFIVALITAVMISSLLVGGLGQIQARGVLTDRIENTELPNLTRAIRNKIDREISILEQATEQLAKNAMIEQWMLNGFPKSEEATVVELLKRMAEQHDLTNASVVNRETAHYWNQDGFLRQLNNDNLDGWFFAFRDSGVVRSKSLYNEDGVPKLFINYQNINGILASGIGRSVEDFQTLLNESKIGKTGFVFLTDGEGTVKLHPNQQLANTASLASLFGNENARQLSRKQDMHLTRIDIDGEEHYVVASFIESAEWYVVAQVPVAELFEEVDAALIEIIIQIIGIAALFAFAAVLFANRLVNPITQLANTFKQLGASEADLDVRLRDQREPELIDLQSGFNSFLDKIKSTIKQMSHTSSDLMSVSDTVAKQADNANSCAQSQSGHTQGVISSIEKLNESVVRIADSAGEAANVSVALKESSNKGLDVSMQTKQTIEDMHKQTTEVSFSISNLVKHAELIENVLSVIKGVSEQTNLLALNAAIEAARAGEQGRGFAVVADEVRSLAQRTHESTEEIGDTIQSLQREVQTAVDLIGITQQTSEQGTQAVEQNQHVLQEIGSSVETLQNMNTQIANTTEHQSQVTRSIINDLDAIRAETEVLLSSSEEVSASSAELTRLSNMLDKLVKQYSK